MVEQLVLNDLFLLLQISYFLF